jgi:hypothetical protein
LCISQRILQRIDFIGKESDSTLAERHRLQAGNRRVIPSNHAGHKWIVGIAQHEVSVEMGVPRTEALLRCLLALNHSRCYGFGHLCHSPTRLAWWRCFE